MVTQIAIKLYTAERLSEGRLLEAIVLALGSAGVAPTETGPEGDPRPFEVAAFLAQVAKSAGPYRFITPLRRTTAPAWDGALHTHDAGPNALIFDGIVASGGPEGVRRWFDLADALAALAPPRFGFVHVYDPSWTPESAQGLAYRDAHRWTLKHAEARGVPVRYARTWIPEVGGPGALRVDLAPEPWSLDLAALRQLSREASQGTHTGKGC